MKTADSPLHWHLEGGPSRYEASVEEAKSATTVGRRETSKALTKRLDEWEWSRLGEKLFAQQEGGRQGPSRSYSNKKNRYVGTIRDVGKLLQRQFFLLEESSCNCIMAVLLPGS